MATANPPAERKTIAVTQTRFTPRVTLTLIILIQVAFGILYAYRTPRWQAPDEPAHYNYVRHIAETGTLPRLNTGDYDQAYLDQIKARKFPADMPVDTIRYENYQPPLYYLVATPVYLLARGIGLDTVLSLRLLSVLFGAVTLGLAFLVLGQLWPESSFLALAAVGTMAVIPMNIALWAAVNADPLSDLVIAMLILVCLARLRGKLQDRLFIVTGGIVYGLALLTSIKLYPAGILLVLAEIGALRSDSRGWSKGWLASAARVLVPLFLVALLTSAWWFVRNALVYGGLDIMGLAEHDRIVIGQPTTAEWIGMYGFKNVFADFFIITFKSFWAQFGWMGVLVNDRIYVGLFLLTAAALLGATLWLIRLVRERGAQKLTTGWNWALLGAWLATVLLAHVWYNLHFVQPQGRYLFPALIPIAALLVVGMNELLNSRHARVVFALLYLALLVLDYISLAWYIVPQLRA